VRVRGLVGGQVHEGRETGIGGWPWPRGRGGDGACLAGGGAGRQRRPGGECGHQAGGGDHRAPPAAGGPSWCEHGGSFLFFLFFLSFFLSSLAGCQGRAGAAATAGAQRREKHRVDQAGGEVRGKRAWTARAREKTAEPGISAGTR
jgi:hypothetical protein